MPVLADLITQSALVAYLSDQGLTPAQTAALPGLTTSASTAIRRFCNRDFNGLTTYDELYTVATPSTTVVLNQFPVASIVRCATNPTGVLTVSNTDAVTNQRALVGLAASGDSFIGFTLTGVSLFRAASGVQSTTVVPITANMTLAGLAAAIIAVGSGWTATAATGYELYPAADFRPPQGMFPALQANTAQLAQHVDDLPYVLRESSGILDLGPNPNSSSDSLRFGSYWSSEVEDGFSYGGTNGVRVVYTAGYSTVPMDVQLGCAETVKAAIDRFKIDAALQSESDGVISWTRAAETPLVIPRQVMVALSSYQNHRA